MGRSSHSDRGGGDFAGADVCKGAAKSAGHFIEEAVAGQGDLESVISKRCDGDLLQGASGIFGWLGGEVGEVKGADPLGVGI